MADREEYENKFPKPPHTFWDDKAGEYNYSHPGCGLMAINYQYGWEVWQAARTDGEVGRQGVAQRVREAVQAICDDMGVCVQSMDVGWGESFGDATVLTVEVVTCG